MKVIINKNELEKFRVNRYKFKLFGAQQDEVVQEEFEPLVSEKVAEPIDETSTQPTSEALQQRDELVESLLKKTDEISSNFIKVQMKLEQSEEDHKADIKRVEQEQFEKGIEEGKKRQVVEFEQSKSAGIEQFSNSVIKLNDTANNFEISLNKIKDELIYAALDIAKEVINMDVCERSADISTKLSEELIKELQGAAHITLKVNPLDQGVVSEKMGKLSNVEVISDSAVSAGGVVAISDAGNIDSDLMKRYERVKEMALKK